MKTAPNFPAFYNKIYGNIWGTLFCPNQRLLRFPAVHNTYISNFLNPNQYLFSKNTAGIILANLLANLYHPGKPSPFIIRILNVVYYPFFPQIKLARLIVRMLHALKDLEAMQMMYCSHPAQHHDHTL